MYCFTYINNNCFEIVSLIEDEKAIEIHNAIKNTGRILKAHQSLSYVKDALADFEKWCAAARADGDTIVRNHHAAERYCRGFLFEFKTYLDHMQAMLSHEYEKAPQVLRAFQAGTHTAYDKSPEYAFTYQLRNCSQHCENVVHNLVVEPGRTGVRPVSAPDMLLKNYKKWKASEKTFIQGHPVNMDLLSIFEKTYDALGYVHTPVIQYMLDHDGVAADVVYLRKWADWLLVSYPQTKEDIWKWHFAHATHADGTEATAEEYNNHVADIHFDVQILDWDSVLDLSSSLEHRKNP